MKNKKYCLLSTFLLIIIGVILIIIGITKLKYNYREELVTSNIDYRKTNNILENPYRGFSSLLHIEIPNYNEKNEYEDLKIIDGKVQSTINKLEENQETIVMLVFYLNNYKDFEHLPDFCFTVMNRVFDTFRENGYKIILRYAYGEEYYDGVENDFKNEPRDFSILLEHVLQISDFVNNNRDSIMLFQLGFIGPWGEMHTSKYADQEHITRLIKVCLENLSSDVNIAVRRPKYYRYYFGDEKFDDKYAFSKKDRVRVSTFNDAFLSSPSDMGTYESGKREEELKWQDSINKYTLFGGEISYKENDYTPTNDNFFEVTSALYNIKKTHLTYLNNNINNAVFKYWQNFIISNDIDKEHAGVDFLTYINNKMGYRYQILDAKIPKNTLFNGDILNFNFTVENEGFSNYILERDLFVLLEKDGKFYKAKTDKNVQNWLINKQVREDFVMQLPNDIEPGKWNIYIYMPDPDPKYANNSKASIKFANNNIYSAELKANYIGSINIKKNSSGTNKGFYQLNSTNSIPPSFSLFTIDRETIIDGKISNKYEWLKNEKYEQENTIIYLKEDEEYIYILGKEISNLNYKNIQLSLITTKSVDNKYNYMIENDRIYNGSFNSNNLDSTSRTKASFCKDEYFEYKIAKERFNITNIKDIQEIEIKYLSEDYDTLTKSNFKFINND